MRKMMVVLASTTTALVVSAGFATTGNAQDISSDQAYCNRLVREFTSNFGVRGGTAPQSLDLSVAIAQCREGNPTPAIPVLQERLRDAGFTVPPRT
jgi:hypothetical protein